jgi:hypothetical protein
MSAVEAIAIPELEELVLFAAGVILIAWIRFMPLKVL